jgi:hypothetical protein
MKQLFLPVLIALTIISCSPSTHIEKSWQEPGASYKVSDSSKIFVLAMVKDESSRRVIEDELVKRIGPNAVASYTIFTSDMLKQANEGVLSEKIKRDNFKYILLMRLANVENETSYVHGTTTGFYGSYGGYYRYGAGMYGSPGYYTTDKNYFVETTVYSVEPDKLLWTGTTKTVNPTKIEKTINEIGDAVSTKMRKDGFLK